VWRLAITRKTRILGVTYNSTNNELVRTNTLVKNSIVQVDATPFRQWYEQHYGVVLGVKKTAKKVNNYSLLLNPHQND
jgi:small subunit ribosomal protein S8e